ncbi:hypothetical protein AALA78_11875 [Lachnospiraceae bacterium 42-17]|jgi:hypothetical protein|nr:hypothetical protein [Dorea sp.]
MLEILLDKYIIYVLIGGAAVCGIVSKLIVSVTLKRLVKASGNMNKSTHPLMRLVRAKFEHACMISEKVENVRVFVDKYLYEYRAAGIKLHSLRRLERASSGACLLLGLLGAALLYSRYGMQEEVLRVGAAGAVAAILVFLIHLVTDENYRLEMARNYMVDYLENVCLHRYEKAYQKEIKVMAPEVPVPDFSEVNEELEFEEESIKNVQEPVRPRPGREVPSPRTSPEITPPVMPEPYDVPNTSSPDVIPPIRGIRSLKEEIPVRDTDRGRYMSRESENTAAEPAAHKPEKKEKSRDIEKDVLIRQILEEFMA